MMPIQVGSQFEANVQVLDIPHPVNSLLFVFIWSAINEVPRGLIGSIMDRSSPKNPESHN